MLRWSITEDDVVHGLRERGLPINSLDDLTGREIELIRQYADMVFDTAAHKSFDMPAARIRQERGREEQI
jgi:hypothetical protein